MQIADLTLAAPAPGTVKPRPVKPTASAFADRGKWAEEQVHKALKAWQGNHPSREASRVLDSRAANRLVRAGIADFEVFCKTAEGAGVYAAIEVKSVKHPSRLRHDHVSQLPRLVKRSKCGGLCGVLVYHSETRLWRSACVEWFEENKSGGSWDMSTLCVYPSAAAALQGLFPLVFNN